MTEMQVIQWAEKWCRLKEKPIYGGGWTVSGLDGGTIKQVPKW
jgi:hypothetical protein